MRQRKAWKSIRCCLLTIIFILSVKSKYRPGAVCFWAIDEWVIDCS